MKVFKGIMGAFSLRRREETFDSVESLANQLDYMVAITLWYEYGLSLVEREIYLKEEIAALEKQRTIDSLMPDREHTLNDWQKELQGTDPIWWFWERNRYKFAVEEPTGRWMCDFNKNFGSAMASKKTQLYCWMRGGCCSKERRTNRPKMEQLGQYVGRCTRSCGCCTRYNRHMGVTDRVHLR
jgi:hypothetical protein